MSYNIDTWTTKTLKDFRIPILSMMGVDDLTARMEREGRVSVDGLAEGFELRGKLDGDVLVVDHLEYWGEFSGSNWDALLAIFKNSTGKLVAVQVWEGGDSITRLYVDDGKIREEKVEL